MANGVDLEWVRKFSAIVYSRDKLHRNKLQKPLVLKQGNDSIILDNDDGGKVVGTLTFYTPHNTRLVKDIEKVANNLFTNFRQSLLLCGYLIEVKTMGAINGTNAGPERLFQVENTITFAWREEGQTRTIDVPSSDQIKSYFVMMFFQTHT